MVDQNPPHCSAVRADSHSNTTLHATYQALAQSRCFNSWAVQCMAGSAMRDKSKERGKGGWEHLTSLASWEKACRYSSATRKLAA